MSVVLPLLPFGLKKTSVSQSFSLPSVTNSRTASCSSTPVNGLMRQPRAPAPMRCVALSGRHSAAMPRMSALG